MKFFAASRKKLPLALFLAAGTLSPCVIFAEETTRDSYDVADGDALRKYLSETYLPEGAEKETYRDNADLNITQDFRVDTTATETSEDADGNESSETTATGSIEVLATGSKILGGGRTISSSEVDLSVKGAGDIFFLDGVTLSVENVAFAGTTDETKKTGRVFTTGNSAAGTTLDIGAGTRFENRRLVADERTNYRAQGGANALFSLGCCQLKLRQFDLAAASFEKCLAASEEYGSRGNLLMGANIAGFLKVARAMQWQGVV